MSWEGENNMKQMTCEMCGSTDLIKQDGVFVCQSCGCKYSPEEAKKIMIEGPVDISGSSIKIDNTDSIPKYLEIAENALESHNFFEAENYSSQILEMDPKNNRAWFIKGKAAGWQSTVGNVRIEEAVNCFGKAIDYATDDEIDELRNNCGFEIEDLSKAFVDVVCKNWCKYMTEDNKNIVINSINDVEKFAFLLLKRCNIKIESFRKDIANIITDYIVYSWQDIIYFKYKKNAYPSDYEFDDFIDEGDMAINLMSLAIDVCDTDDTDDIVRYKNLIVMEEALRDSCSYEYNGYGYEVSRCLTEKAKKLRNDDILEWHKKIKEIDNSYVIPPIKEIDNSYVIPPIKEIDNSYVTPPIKEEKKGGCYVATAVYGSYDCPQVWVLRRFRDYTLAETWYGRLFIKSYYAVSPTVVKCFDNNKFFVSIFKPMLDRLVNRLKLAGVLDTPYNDKGW